MYKGNKQELASFWPHSEYVWKTETGCLEVSFDLDIAQVNSLPGLGLMKVLSVVNTTVFHHASYVQTRATTAYHVRTLEIAESDSIEKNRIVNEPEFDTVGELMDDLQFKHILNIAQNDAKDTNIMINWSPIHDVLIHGASVDMKADWSGPAKPRRRTTQGWGELGMPARRNVEFLSDLISDAMK
ncbi:hypothetical protein GG344DRAFT_69195 [Lentinula edodes]|nr:hypothetical protein GG344DRAFT_69195 [Lentinula edodes]